MRKNKLLLGASILTIHMSTLSSSAFAQTCIVSQSRNIECLNYKGNPIDVSFCNTYVASIGNAPPSNRDCTVPCPPPPSYGGDGDGDYGYDTDGDGRGDTRDPSEGDRVDNCDRC
tara:strand:- start:58 stop:402 length:345 start_codon:yes stop_codon:yes gene_type:complete